MLNLIVTLLLSQIFPFQSVADEGEQTQVKILMHTFEDEFAKISSYLTTDEAFKSPAARKKIIASLDAIEKATQQPPKMLQEHIGFAVNYQMLARQFADANKLFKRGEYDYSRVLINSTTNFCISCHTQQPATRKNKEGFVYLESKIKNTSFDNAEFLFVVRRYTEALKQYDELVRKYPSGLKPELLSQVTRRKLAIFARINRDPKQAVASFEMDLKNKNLPVDIQADIKSWLEYLRAWSDEGDPGLKETRKLLKFVSENTTVNDRRIAPSDPEAVKYLRLTGMLYEKLFQEPNTSNTQEILFNLANLEKKISPLFWYSISDVYLTECISKFPKKAYSQKCYDAYKTTLENRYLLKGPLPEDLKQTLEMYKKYL